MSRPKLSCVIPTLNSAWCLGETLQSIVGQTNVDARVIVVDSESSDNTLAICHRFGVETKTEPPGNMYRAINKGLRSCDTEWLGYTNADDPWYGDGLERALQFGHERDADVVYGTCDCIDEKGRFLFSFRPPMPQYLGAFFRTRLMPFFQQTILFKRSLFERLNGFDEHYTFCADFDFLLRAYSQGARFECVPGRPLSRSRLHARQLSQLNVERAEAQKRESSQRAGLEPTITDKLSILRWRASNWPNYVERVIRGSQLRGRFVLPRSLDA